MQSNYSFIITIILISLILYILRVIILRIFRKLSENNQKTVLRITYKSIQIPSILWVIIISTFITLLVSNTPELRKFLIFPIPKEYIEIITKTNVVILIVSITILLEQLLTMLLERYFETKHFEEAKTGIFSFLVKGTVYTIGTIIILHYLGVEILPIITTLGIGGLLIGLALKDTLSNIFSGIYIISEKNIKIGDFIELENGKRGYVININWRTTTVRTLTNDLVIIPNEKLAQSIVYNYSEPVKETRMTIELNVSYDTDIEKLERVVLDETYKFASEDQRLLLDPPPVFRFIPGFGNSSLNFSLIFTAKDYESGLIIQSELRKKLFKRLIQEGIEIPYQKVDVYIKKD